MNRRFATLSIAWILLACGAHAAEPKLRIEPYVFETSGSETVAAELGSFEVPENRDAADSRTLTLRFVRFPSTSPDPRPPIVYLAGGPGGSGISTARGSRFPLFMALREHGDVIAFDQRGTGMSGSDDVACEAGFLIPFGEPADRQRATAILAEAAAKCAARLTAEGVDIAGYDTRDSAADLADLRRALGAKKLVLWGISYGTHLALATMKYHPEAIDRVILAGLEGPDQTLKLPSHQQQLLEEIARLAASDPAVREAVPDLLGSVESLLERLDEEPVTVSLTDPRSGMVVGIGVGPLDLQAALAGMLRGPDSFAPMPDLVHRLEEGDWTALALLSAGRRMGQIWPMMSLAMDCASGATEARLERIATEAETTLLGDAINAPYPEICDGVPVPDLGDDFRAPVVSDIPALLISGTLDGRTPVANGDEVASHLGASRHLVIEGAGHSDPLFLSSPKILETMQAFLRGDEPAALRIALDDPVDFIPPRSITQVSPEVLDRYVGTYRIEGDDTRRVVRAGDLLFTRRGEGDTLPIRPTSTTRFFYEGSKTWLEFEVDPEGAVRGMRMHHDGAEEGEWAERVE
ncbi:MAG: alpha/beta fold hydrolase [Thermoanaerobaculia bacterium]|nr:alpha/beta fold hydrolase [Thermoanaerobaculia bacterium]